LNDDDLRALQIAIMTDPNRPPVISGTGGLRKLRFAPERWTSGKSGAARVCYVYFAEFSMALLAIAFSKNEKENLSRAERNQIKKVVDRIRQELKRRRSIR
jgi:hypothetical protein